MRHWCYISLLGFGFLICSCSTAPKVAPSASVPQPPVARTDPMPSRQVARVTNRPANPNGAVFVVMYHHLGDRKDPMFRSVRNFKSDLTRMDKLGFRPVTVTQYLTNNMDLPPGASPAVFTFDDSNPDQLQLRKDGTLDPNCMLGIWSQFAAAHPEFPIRATFFVLPDVMFGQPKMLSQKLALLKGWGCELGNHTVHHLILRNQTDDKVKSEIGDAEADLVKIGATSPLPLALPFGSSPRNRSLLRGFNYRGQDIKPTGVFLVGANPGVPVTSAVFDKLRISRIQANEEIMGLTYWLDAVEKGKVHPFVEG